MAAGAPFRFWRHVVTDHMALRRVFPAAALEQIEGERTRRDEEHEDPDRPVIEAVVELVVFADLALRGIFDRESVHGFFLRVLRRFDAGVLVRDVGGRLAVEGRV